MAGAADTRVPRWPTRERSSRRPDPPQPILGGLTGMPILLVALALLSAPAGARSLEVVGNAGHLGEWELSATLTQTGPHEILRTLEHDACRYLHAGRPGAENGRDTFGKARVVLSSASDSLRRRRRMHLRRNSVRLLFRIDELPRPASGALDHVGKIKVGSSASEGLQWVRADLLTDYCNVRF